MKLVTSSRDLAIQFGGVLLVMLLFGCGQDASKVEKRDAMTDKPISSTEWQKLADKRIFFGHQSVGYNILAGVEDLLRENPGAKLDIIEMTGRKIPDGPLLLHARVGKNLAPVSKCDDFAEKMDSLGPSIDLAILKFCYVDITAGTDVAATFAYYRETISKLKKKYPNTRFVHMTVPLSIAQDGPKALIKKLIGRPVDGYKDNVSRESYNELLKKEYLGKDPVFDLSLAESTDASGRQSSFSTGGKTYLCLNPDYTDDGGHLNERGRKFVAGRFLDVLARQ